MNVVVVQVPVQLKKFFFFNCMLQIAEMGIHCKKQEKASNFHFLKLYLLSGKIRTLVLSFHC